ncbi:MAG: HAMP domain-containing protein [Magnetococcales bacterium]|nr:HAMP domain-containing protein [Magnetococcales bacterium]
MIALPTLRPFTLSTRLFLILFGGLAAALLVSAALFQEDRGKALHTVGGLHVAQRVAAVVQLLDSLEPHERRRIVRGLQMPWQSVRLIHRAPPMPDMSDSDKRAAMVRTLLSRHLDERWPFRVIVRAPPGSDAMDSGPPDIPAEIQEKRMKGAPPWALKAMRHQQRIKNQRLRHHLPGDFSFIAQVRLQDGVWAEFQNHLPKEAISWPSNLLWPLMLLFLAVLILSFLAVRLLTRPLRQFCQAAEALGKDIHHPPQPETGPPEVRQAARAFNGMQARVVRYVQERTHLLAALSHDLKTPITRMRLRTELLEDDSAREGLLKDLAEMEEMTRASLDYIKGMEGMENRQRMDITAMLENLQTEYQEMGQPVTLKERAALPPFPVMPQSLKRALTNLVENAVRYGGNAELDANIKADTSLEIHVRDRGPGISEADLSRVLEPFVRLESSRNRHTGGTGLGLSIASNIARAHGGELQLRNRTNGGLCATLVLPKSGK